MIKNDFTLIKESQKGNMKAFEELSNDRQVVRYDQLGSGKSDVITDTALFTVDHFVKDIKPKLCILQHFGMSMILKKPWEKAILVEEKTGIKTVAARDGQIFDVSSLDSAKKAGLDRFV